MINLKSVTPIGGGLKVLINVDYTFNHDWMAFASWYSINKNLPDAEVKILCKRNTSNYQIFNWPSRCNVKFSYIPHIDDENFLQITPDVMAVSDFNAESMGPIDCKMNEISTFVSYLNGCGLFRFSDKEYCPFQYCSKLYSEDLSFNEYRIFKIWDRLLNLHNYTRI